LLDDVVVVEGDEPSARLDRSDYRRVEAGTRDIEDLTTEAAGIDGMESLAFGQKELAEVVLRDGRRHVTTAVNGERGTARHLQQDPQGGIGGYFDVGHPKIGRFNIQWMPSAISPWMW